MAKPIQPGALSKSIIKVYLKDGREFNVTPNSVELDIVDVAAEDGRDWVTGLRILRFTTTTGIPPGAVVKHYIFYLDSIAGVETAP